MHSQQHILDAFGNTPLVAWHRIVAKLESANPTGSMKDRLARMIVQRAAAAGRLPPGGTMVEYTAGTTWILLALVASALGYKTHFAFSDAFSDEKRFAMLAYGATLTDRAQRQQADHQGPDSGDDCQSWSNQPAARPLVGRSTEQHRRGRWLRGPGRRNLAAYRRSCRCAGPHRQHRAFAARDEPGATAAQPRPARLCGGTCRVGGVVGAATRAHKIKGIGLGFLPPLWHPDEVTEILTVATEDAKAMARRLAREDAIFAGISTGANIVGCRGLRHCWGRASPWQL